MIDAARALGTGPGRGPGRLPAQQGKVWPKRDQVGTEDRLVTGAALGPWFLSLQADGGAQTQRLPCPLGSERRGRRTPRPWPPR